MGNSLSLRRDTAQTHGRPVRTRTKEEPHAGEPDHSPGSAEEAGPGAVGQLGRRRRLLRVLGALLQPCRRAVAHRDRRGAHAGLGARGGGGGAVGASRRPAWASRDRDPDVPGDRGRRRLVPLRARLPGLSGGGVRVRLRPVRSRGGPAGPAGGPGRARTAYRDPRPSAVDRERGPRPRRGARRSRPATRHRGRVLGGPGGGRAQLRGRGGNALPAAGPPRGRPPENVRRAWDG